MKTGKKYTHIIQGDPINQLCKETKESYQIQSLEECDISMENNVPCEIVT